MGRYLDIARQFEAKRQATKRQQGACIPVTAAAPEHPPMSEHDRFLARYAGATVTEVFSDLRGILVTSDVLDMPVWVVRNRTDGEDLARETGHPALLVDDILRQRGKSKASARAALLPLLITGTVH
ncbi:MAG: hypothetical protein AB1671_19640 [Thermodesulfobacteriota bacterium]|jgi:hypothetical protein